VLERARELVAAAVLALELGHALAKAELVLIDALEPRRHAAILSGQARARKSAASPSTRDPTREGSIVPTASQDFRGQARARSS